MDQPLKATLTATQAPIEGVSELDPKNLGSGPPPSTQCYLDMHVWAAASRIWVKSGPENMGHKYKSILGQICPAMAYQDWSIHTVSFGTYRKHILDTCQWYVHMFDLLRSCHVPNNTFYLCWASSLSLVEHPHCSLDQWSWAKQPPPPSSPRLKAKYQQ